MKRLSSGSAQDRRGDAGTVPRSHRLSSLEVGLTTLQWALPQLIFRQSTSRKCESGSRPRQTLRLFPRKRNQRSVKKSENANRLQIFIEKRAFGQLPNAHEFSARALRRTLRESVSRFVDLPKTIRKIRMLDPSWSPRLQWHDFDRCIRMKINNVAEFPGSSMGRAFGC